jgi:tol-pal system protein YbgF
MLKLLSSTLRGTGLRSGPLGRGREVGILVLLGLTLSGCATKRDVRDLQSTVSALAAQQEATLAELQGLNVAVQDTLRGQSDALFESRGEILRRLRELEQQLITLHELTGQNQRALATIRDLLEGQRSSALAPMRTDTEPGQVVNPTFAPTGPPTTDSEAALQTFNAGVAAFNRGSITTARRAFQQFIQDYPTDPLAPEAYFYLADLLYQENRLEEAIQAFLRVRELFPAARRVPDALYRVGVIYIDLEQLDNAREYLQRVITSYPDSDAAVLAQERLDEIS